MSASKEMTPAELVRTHASLIAHVEVVTADRDEARSEVRALREQRDEIREAHRVEVAALTAKLAALVEARTLDEWSEDVGDVLWWRFPIEEPPYCGSPICDDWPGYHTHWTPIEVPEEPARGAT